MAQSVVRSKRSSQARNLLVLGSPAGSNRKSHAKNVDSAKRTQFCEENQGSVPGSKPNRSHPNPNMLGLRAEQPTNRARVASPTAGPVGATKWGFAPRSRG